MEDNTMVTPISRKRYAGIPALSFLLSLGPCGLFAQEESSETQETPIEEIRVTSNGVAFTLGVENLFDKTYIDHLSGFNRVFGSVVPQGSRLYGEGMNLFGRVRQQW
ncbi:hypothetical protein [Candidatus Foliamicus sp.]